MYNNDPMTYNLSLDTELGKTIVSKLKESDFDGTKPLTVNDKVNAICSLKKPKPGQIMQSPNEDGILVQFSPHEFWLEIRHNWAP